MQEFDIELGVEQIKVGGELYEIRELTHDGRKRHMRAIKDTMEVRLVGTNTKDAAGQEFLRKEILVKDFDACAGALLKETMFKINEDGSGTPVSDNHMREWGAKLVEKLANVASLLNGLNQTEETKAEEAEKN